MSYIDICFGLIIGLIFTYLVYGFCRCCYEYVHVVNSHEDEQIPRLIHRRPPPVPSRPIRAQDLETGLHHTPTAPDITLLKFEYTPDQCRQYLSECISVHVTHRQYKLALHSSQQSDSLVGFWTECVICLSEFEDADACFVIGSCTHVFHRHCAISWLTLSHMVCPICRSRVNLNVFMALDPSMPVSN